METTPRKGLSKGCLIGLIISLSVLAVIILSLVLMWVYRGSITRFGAGAAAIELKTVLAKSAPEGVDTVRFNALTDAFIDRVKQEGDEEFESLAFLVDQFYRASKDKILTREEAMTAAAAMIARHPDLEPYWLTESEAEPETDEVTEPVQDSADLE